jgi:predicted transcriptional regulator
MPMQKKTFTKDDYTLVEKCAAKGCNSRTIAGVLGICKATLYHHLQEDDKLCRLYKKGRATASAAIASKLYENCLKGDNASIFFYLKTQCDYVEGDKSESLMKKFLKYLRTLPKEPLSPQAMADKIEKLLSIDI